MYQATSSGPNGVALLNGNRQLAAGLEPWGTIGLGRGMQPWGIMGGTLGAGGGDVASLMASTGVREYAGGVWSSYQCGGCAQAIVDMQAQLSRAGAALGIRGTITADGVVGDATLAYAKAVGAAAIRRYEYVAEGAGITGAATTKERLARNAIAVGDFARSIANRLGAPPVTAPPPTQPTQPAPVSTGPTAPMPPMPTFPEAPSGGGGLVAFVKARWPWFVGGGILAAGAATTLAILAIPAPRATARGRR